LIFEILTQKNEIEMYAKQNENPEEFLKDLKDLTTNSPFSIHLESEREKERAKKKLEKIKKLEKQFKEDEKRWERHEEERDREKIREIQLEEELIRRKKRRKEKDLNYDSEEEKIKIKQNPKKFEEHRAMRDKEKEMDDLFRKKENPIEISENENNIKITDLVLSISNEMKIKEPEAKTMVTLTEYHEDIEDINENYHTIINQNISLNLDSKKMVSNKPIIFCEEDQDINDPYNKKLLSSQIDINPETEKEILEMKNEKIKYAENIDENKEKNISKKEHLQSVNKNIMDNKQSMASLTPNKLLEIHKQIYECIPKNTDELLKFPINWSIVYKFDILENKIKSWLSKKLSEFLGEDEPELRAIIIKKLANKTNPYELMEKIRSVFEEDTEVKFYFYL
jgi:RNA-binding protein 25